MAAKYGKGRIFPLLVLIVAIALWVYEQKYPVTTTTRKQVSQPEKLPAPAEFPAPSKPRAASNLRGPEQTGGYETYRGCSLVNERNNDGDSFLVKLSDGREVILRLYFVDTPESAFKSYRGGDTNHARIADQAADLGGITSQQAVEIGKQAKAFTLALLASAPFDIFTRWDSPFHDRRYHAFIRVKSGGKTRWLHELLVEKGFVRIHTKGAALPDGTTYQKQKARLKALERTAKNAGSGVWGL
jgi:endonuclease YncB( thermonuclease family)